MSMSRKHYEEIAKVISRAVRSARELSPEAGSGAAVTTAENIAIDLAVVFEGDNPNFDPSRFLRVCGVQS